MEMQSRRDKMRERNRLTAGATTSVNDLTDDLLELILLGLDSPVCLVRAAATCKQWRLLVAGGDGAFLRRFRSFHPPRAIGTYYNITGMPCSFGRFHNYPAVDPVFVPSSASATDGPAGRLHDLSLDFLPRADEPPELVDARGSLLLLLKEKEGTQQPYPCSCGCYDNYGDYIVPDLVVCEPVTRRYQAIPPPDDRVCILGAFLLDADGDELGGVTMTNFRVLLVLFKYGDYEVHTDEGQHGYPSASVFTNSGCGWLHLETEYGVYLPRLDQVHLAGRTGGCIYWGCDDKQVMLLDEHTLEFATMEIPDHMKTCLFDRSHFRVVGGGDGTVRIVHLTAGGGGHLKVFSQPHGTEDWVLDTTIELVEASRGLPEHKEEYFAAGTEIIDADEGLVVLSPNDTEAWLFSVDLGTMELKRECGRGKYDGSAFPYTLPWPPVLRAASICKS